MTDFVHSLAVVIGIDAYVNGIPRNSTPKPGDTVASAWQSG